MFTMVIIVAVNPGVNEEHVVCERITIIEYGARPIIAIGADIL